MAWTLTRLTLRTAYRATVAWSLAHLAASAWHAWYHTTGAFPCGVWCPLAGHPYIPGGHRPRRTI